jgi:uncharacterized protein
MKNPFRLTLARGDAFCNREKEKELLCRNIRSGIHMVVYAPRRYGKSSLALAVGDLLPDIVSIYVDLLSITSQEDVAEKIYRAIVTALGKRAADTTTLAARLLASFKNLRLGMEVNPATAMPELSVSLGESPVEKHLEEIIGALDHYCAAQGLQACLVLDEFQEICELKESKKVEALLRAGMQAAQHVTFLVMGSRRTILRDMFEDRKRPFYKSASVLPLPRISTDAFATFLATRHAAAGKPLSEAGAREMVEYVDGYPYYVQKLAMLHFDLEGADAIANAKEMLIDMEAGDFQMIFLSLTNHQKNLLRSIAKHRPANIHSQAFLTTNRLGSQGGVQSSLAKLKKMDLAEMRDGLWRVVDPVFEQWLMRQ